MEKVLLDAQRNIRELSGFWFSDDGGFVDVTSEEPSEGKKIRVKDVFTLTQYMVDRHGKLVQVWGFDEEVTPF